jgi:hypothetical protein
VNVEGLVSQAVYTSLQDSQANPSINAGYLTYGTYELGNILDEFKDWIPFAQELTYDNIDELTETLFVSVSNVNYVLNTVQTPLMRMDLTRFNDNQTILGLVGVPQYYYFDELKQTIMVYPNPSNPQYSFTVWGRESQEGLTTFSVLPLNMPPFQINFLIYKLAHRCCARFGTYWSDDKDKILMRLERNLMIKRDLDFTPRRNIVMGRPGTQGIPGFPYFFWASGGGQGL